jgi:glycine/D-amino acid oxidase-like deaminating enzyme
MVLQPEVSRTVEERGVPGSTLAVGAKLVGRTVDGRVHRCVRDRGGAPPDFVIVGGGFYGCRIAIALAREGRRVLLLEAGDDLMHRASYVNQARVHGGYHYPRSLLTALRSRVNLPAFVAEYADCIDRSFAAHYAIARHFSHISHRQFRLFCERIQAPIRRAPERVRRLFNDDLVDDVFTVEEYAFDADKIRRRLVAEMSEAGVRWLLGATVTRVTAGNGALTVEYEHLGVASLVASADVLNCTYSRLNQINRASGLPEIGLKHEIAEIALIEPPAELDRVGVTVMCGPFFSVMPFPSRDLHTLTHVRYTPHTEWHEPTPAGPRDPYHFLARARPASAFTKMLADARRYLPSLARSRYVESLYEVKTVLPQSEHDDSRPILFRTDHGVPGYTCIIGGKLDNVYDVCKELTAYTARAPRQPVP